jgi:hypothetical protein
MIRPLVLAEGHFAGDQQFEFFGVHDGSGVCIEVLENTGILHEGQMTDHANNAHTDRSIIFNLLKTKEKVIF